MSKPLLVDRHDDGIVVITFNRPDRLNALNQEAMDLFAAAIDRLVHDDSLRILILTGAEQRAFCSGGDLNELSQKKTAREAREMISLMGNALLKMERLPVPVIAAINGYALGGGSEIALACDLRIIDEKARLGLVQMRLGLTPGWGAGQRLLRLVGYPKAMEFLLRAHVLHAPEIKQLGLARSVVEPGTALEHTLNFARHLVELPAAAVSGVKQLLVAGLIQPYEQALQTERDIFPPLWAADEHHQAVDAFLERQRAYEADKQQQDGHLSKTKPSE